MLRSLLIIAITATLTMSGAQAAPSAFFDKLSGSWSGSGQADISKLGDISASCRIMVAGTETKTSMNGSCGKLLFRQALGLSIRNSGGNKYVGTYTGSKTGPAKLEGTLRGNRLMMTISWGGLVNGDRKAKMVLERTGPNSFVQTVIDSVQGKTRRTSTFVFKRL